MPENSNYEPIIVSVDDFRTGVAKICGVAVEVLQRKRLL
jgi:SOS-response transcriptional repressor LexA